MELWFDNYDPSVKPKGMTQAKRNYYKRLNSSLLEICAADTIIIAEVGEGGALEEKRKILKTNYVNINAVANVKTQPLGTDNFGSDVPKELVSVTGVSIKISLLASVDATVLGLLLGLLAGYLGGLADDLIMFVTKVL